VPASLGLFLLRHEITSLILFGGKFTEYDLIMTSRLLGIFCFGVVFQGVLPVLVRGFYALQNTFIPLVLGLVSLGISFCISFFGAVFLDFGVYAIALGSVIAVFFQTAAFFHLLSLQIKKRCNFINLNTFSNMLIATLIMSFVVIYIRDLFSTGVDFVYRVLQIALASGIGAGIYFAIVSYLSRKNCIKKLFKR